MRRRVWRRLCDVEDTALIPILQFAGDVSDAEAMEETRADSKSRKRAGSRFLQDEADASEGSDDESADEHASDADSNGDLKGFTVPDAEASESNHETDEEIEEPPARRRLQRYHTAMGELSAVDEAKLKNLMRRACRVARGRPR